MKEDLWGDLVTVVHADMRYWKAPELVSYRFLYLKKYIYSTCFF